jgi:hypothetical protein
LVGEDSFTGFGPDPGKKTASALGHAWAVRKVGCAASWAGLERRQEFGPSLRKE